MYTTSMHIGSGDSTLNTATVGIPMALIGAFIIYVTRLNITVRKGMKLARK